MDRRSRAAWYSTELLIMLTPTGLFFAVFPPLRTVRRALQAVCNTLDAKQMSEPDLKLLAAMLQKLSSFGRSAPFNSETSISIQKHHPYTKNLNSEMPRASKPTNQQQTFLHEGWVLEAPTCGSNFLELVCSSLEDGLSLL